MTSTPDSDAPVEAASDGPDAAVVDEAAPQVDAVVADRDEDVIADAEAAEASAADAGDGDGLLEIAEESAEADGEGAADAEDAAAVDAVESAADPGEPAAVAPSEPVEPDPRLFEAHDLARSALSEVTPASTIGAAAGYAVENDGVVSLRFANLLPGYPGWFWTVSVAVVDGAEPTVLEVELLPGDGALLAPEWLPWAERLAEYQAAQAAAADDESDDADGDDEDDEDSDDDLDEDVDDVDAADFDTDGSPILHAGDVDGVDIDELDDDADDDDSEDDSDDEDSEEDDSGDEDDSDDEDAEELREY